MYCIIPTSWSSQGLYTLEIARLFIIIHQEMSLLNIVSRSRNLISKKGLIFKTPIILCPAKNWNTVCLCNYAERKYIRKVFNPALGDSETAGIGEQEVTVERITLQEMMVEQKKEKQKMRKLNKFDKYILVKMGKFKKIEDVPNELVYTTMEKKKEGDTEIKGFILGNLFKFGYSFEYMAFFLSGIFLIFAFTAHKKYGITISDSDKTQSDE